MCKATLLRIMYTFNISACCSCLIQPTAAQSNRVVSKGRVHMLCCRARMHFLPVQARHLYLLHHRHPQYLVGFLLQGSMQHPACSGEEWLSEASLQVLAAAIVPGGPTAILGW
jgi:hypothetical protein